MDRRTYGEVHAFLFGLGGSMVWKGGGHGGGGDWTLGLRGQQAVVGIRGPGREVGLLDKLYVLKDKTKQPKRWDEEAWESSLVPDAFWILVREFPWQPAP